MQPSLPDHQLVVDWLKTHRKKPPRGWIARLFGEPAEWTYDIGELSRLDTDGLIDRQVVFKTSGRSGELPKPCLPGGSIGYFVYDGRESTMKRENYEQDLARRLRDPRFRAAYERERERVTLATQIREVRRWKHWTQAQMARKLGTSQSALARLESGSYDGYTVGMLRRIARVTGCRLQIRLEPPVVRSASKRKSAG